MRVELQAENGEAAAAGDGGGGTEVKKEKKRGFTRSDSFKAAFGPTMVSVAATLHDQLIAAMYQLTHTCTTCHTLCTLPDSLSNIAWCFENKDT